MIVDVSVSKMVVVVVLRDRSVSEVKEDRASDLSEWPVTQRPWMAQLIMLHRGSVRLETYSTSVDVLVTESTTVVVVKIVEPNVVVVVAVAVTVEVTAATG